MRELAGTFAARVEKLLAEQDQAVVGSKAWDARVETVYQLALSRLPTPAERRLGVATLEKLVADWQGDRQAALETYCHTVLNSAAFIYID